MPKVIIVVVISTSFWVGSMPAWTNGIPNRVIPFRMCSGV